MTDGLGIRAPTVGAIAEHQAELAAAARIPVLEVQQPLSDLRALTGLTNVASLRVSCRARDLTPLQALSGLVHLHLTADSVLGEPTNGWAPLPALRRLCVHGYVGPRGPLRLDWLRHFPGLESLELGSVVGRPVDLDGLRSLPRLQELRLTRFIVADLRPLAELPSLRRVVIGHSQIRSFRGLEAWDGAASSLALELAGSNFVAAELASAAARAPRIAVAVPTADPPPLPPPGEWSPREEAPPLPSPLHEAGLRLARRIFRDDLLALDTDDERPPLDQPVLVAPDLEVVAAHRASLARLPHIAALMVQAPVLDLRPLVGLDNLAGLWVHCVDPDLTPLRALPRLERLYVRWGSVVCRPAEFGPLTRLRRLVIAGYVGPDGGEADLEWLRAMPRLERLEIEGGSDRTLDLSGLTNLHELRTLRLRGFRIAQPRPIGELPQLQAVELEDGEVASLAGLLPWRGKSMSLRLRATRVPARELATLQAQAPGLTVEVHEPG
ncbi:hypothetical protein OV090_37265 [Nannocystis sp. RBIL2]|uniref:hypothetical protein n=1 Tax=Nannocystis sp. RBIL2 TaxID=2996788 RepID=UPI00226D82B7|nr:hypothetical protein [Nannocystis sp. RBIL2]MCY1070451.1 hypothetical protein [Nannocystis sp. RBIL2]